MDPLFLEGSYEQNGIFKREVVLQDLRILGLHLVHLLGVVLIEDLSNLVLVDRELLVGH